MRLFRSVKMLLASPCLMLAGLFGRKRKPLKKTKQKEKAGEAAEELNLQSEKRVSFSPFASVYMYPAWPARHRRRLSLMQYANSLPPKKKDGAERLKGSSKETPLAKRVLERMEHKQTELDELKGVLFAKKKMAMEYTRPRSRSRILSILDGYSDATQSDVVSSEQPAKELDVDTSAHENLPHSPRAEKETKRSKAKRSHKKREEERERAKEEKEKNRKKNRKSRDLEENLSGHSLSQEDLQSISTQISDILKKHISKTPSKAE